MSAAPNAERYAREAVAADPDGYAGYDLLAGALCHQGKHQEAVAVARTAVGQVVGWAWPSSGRLLQLTLATDALSLIPLPLPTVPLTARRRRVGRRVLAAAWAVATGAR